jgi:hypothetical protein
MTIIDARTYTIPLILAWVPTVAALVLHAGHAAWFQLAHGDLENLAPGLWIATDGTRWRSAEGWLWTLSGPLPRNWGIIGGSIGGVLGILVSLGLQRLGLIRHSFADYETWEREALEKEKRAREAEIERGEAGPVVPSDADGPGGAAPAEQDAAHLWIQYPHARREMVIESAFVGPIVIMAVAGAWLARALSVRLAGPWSFDPQVGGLVPEVDAPLWLTVLGGVCLGYLVGGGVVWAVRILGSLAFGKEAMGIGDVHLMAAVGACLGWVDAVLGFFGAAFVGLGYAILSQIVGGKMKRAMPFGPFLAISTVLVLLFKPAIEIGLARLFGSAGMIDLP